MEKSIWLSWEPLLYHRFPSFAIPKPEQCVRGLLNWRWLRLLGVPETISGREKSLSQPSWRGKLQRSHLLDTARVHVTCQ